MAGRTYLWVICVFAAMCGPVGGAPPYGDAAEDREPPKYALYSALLPPTKEWKFNDYWLGRTIGPKQFYMADQGPYLRITEEGIAMLKQVGLYDRMIPGHINYSFIKYFLPEERARLKNGSMKRMFERILANKWPVHTIFYCRFQGNPPPSQRLIHIIKDQWIGDGLGETVYRLEPVFHYLKTGKRWAGSSMYLWDPPAAIRFFEHDLMPRLQDALPFIRDLDHKWTRPELRTLSDIYCEEFYRPAKRPVAWGMYVGNYHLASLPETVAVGDKGADAFMNARSRGTMRQVGGNKFYFVWRGHEPTEMYGYFNRAWFTTRGDEWGLPLPHVWYYIYRPYLVGANYYVNEGFPGSCIQDIEGDGQLELSTLGYILKDMLDFVDRHPDRGVAYSPIALMLDYNRAFGASGATYFGYNLPNDDADYFTAAILGTLFPDHRHAFDSGGYSRTAPFGEIFDILQPNVPATGADPKALENYKILIALGGMTFDEDFSAKVKKQVRRGSTLVLNAADATGNLGGEFLGFSFEKDQRTVAGGDVICTLCGKVIEEPDYRLYAVKLTSAEAVFKDTNGRPVVTRNRYGNGHVITVLPHYAIESEKRRIVMPRGARFWTKNLLNFVPHLLEHLVVGVTPIEVRRTSQDRPDLSWIVSKKGDGWLVTMFDYSCARESIVSKTLGTANVHAEYPLREVPFQIVCRAPVEDVVEWYGDRDVHWEKVDGKAVISETMHGGEIRVYELQPHQINLGTRRRYVDYALNRPAKASSSRKGYGPERAVDGDLASYWWSDSDPKRHYVFEMPQWIQVDLGEVKTIDHVFVLFHYWRHESLKTRLRVYKYVVEASSDGEQWQTVMDESKNEDNARREGTERWFEPISARYVRLTVKRNSAFGGARLIEMKVMGTEREEYPVQRKSILPPWEVRYPASVRDVPGERLTYLVDLQPEKAVVGWLPAGRKWADMNGEVKLMTSLSGERRAYGKSVYAQASSEIVYNLGGNYKTFAAAIGLGNNSGKSSVRFRVYVAGQQKSESPLYRIGMPVMPVVVDVSDASELKLAVTDGGDGNTNDYAWWGEARLIRK